MQQEKTWRCCSGFDVARENEIDLAALPALPALPCPALPCPLACHSFPGCVKTAAVPAGNGRLTDQSIAYLRAGGFSLGGEDAVFSQARLHAAPARVIAIAHPLAPGARAACRTRASPAAAARPIRLRSSEQRQPQVSTKFQVKTRRRPSVDSWVGGTDVERKEVRKRVGGGRGGGDIRNDCNATQ